MLSTGSLVSVPDDLLIATLEGLGVPVFRQGSLDEGDEYPERFYTYWNTDSEGGAFYDNDTEAKTVWEFQIAFYSTEPADTVQGLTDALFALRDTGFITSGKGFDVGSDEKSHTGRAARVSFIEIRRT